MFRSKEEERIEFFLQVLQSHRYLFKYIPTQHDDKTITKLSNNESSSLFRQTENLVTIYNDYSKNNTSSVNESTNEINNEQGIIYSVERDIREKQKVPVESLRRSARQRKPTIPKPTPNTTKPSGSDNASIQNNNTSKKILRKVTKQKATPPPPSCHIPQDYYQTKPRTNPKENIANSKKFPSTLINDIEEVSKKRKTSSNEPQSTTLPEVSIIFQIRMISMKKKSLLQQNQKGVVTYLNLLSNPFFRTK